MKQKTEYEVHLLQFLHQSCQQCASNGIWKQPMLSSLIDTVSTTVELFLSDVAMTVNVQEWDSRTLFLCLLGTRSMAKALNSSVL